VHVPLFGWVHAPAAHTSLVQVLPSSPHAAVVAVNVQPVAVLQLSVVQALLSLHTTGVVAQPVAVLQLSVVQALLSLQLSGVPGWQPLVAAHVSCPLHTELSAHSESFGGL
jgi:hypothetical protein